MTARVTEAALAKAARVAASEGVCIEWRDGVWKITPVRAQDDAAQRSADRLDLMDLKRRG